MCGQDRLLDVRAGDCQSQDWQGGTESGRYKFRYEKFLNQ